MSARPCQAGFTLAELLGGLAIAAMLLLPLADMLRVGTDSARGVRAGLDLNTDARFALDRIVARAALASAGPAGASGTPATWLAPFTYTLRGTDLVETDTRIKPALASVLASNVTAFGLAAPEVVDGQPLLAITLALQAEGSSVTRTRTVRVGGMPIGAMP